MLCLCRRNFEPAERPQHQQQLCQPILWPEGLQVLGQHVCLLIVHRHEQSCSRTDCHGALAGAALGLQTNHSTSNGFASHGSGLKGYKSWGSEPSTPGGTPRTPRKGVQPGSFVDLLVRLHLCTA